jgi:hypothetical protein
MKGPFHLPFKPMHVAGGGGSSVSTVTTLRVRKQRNRGSIASRCKRYSLLRSVQNRSGPHPPSYWIHSGGYSPGLRRRKLKANHSIRNVLKVNGLSLNWISGSPIRLHGKDTGYHYFEWTALVRGCDSSVGIATRYRLNCPGIESRWEPDFSHPFIPDLGAWR